MGVKMALGFKLGVRLGVKKTGLISLFVVMDQLVSDICFFLVKMSINIQRDGCGSVTKKVLCILETDTGIVQICCKSMPEDMRRQIIRQLEPHTVRLAFHF